jgi:hypothetical protein
VAALARQFAETSSCQVDDLWSARVAEALGREAEAEMGRATLAFANAYEAAEGGGLTGPVLYFWSPGGPLLQALVRSDCLRSLAQRITGREMTPLDAAYLYYQHGNFCELHTDRSDFEVQLMISVLGDMGPLIVHPELAGALPSDVARRCAREGAPGGGVELWYPRLGVRAFCGTEIPHRRPPHASSGQGAVANLCYRSRASSAAEPDVPAGASARNDPPEADQNSLASPRA